ncbi:hypothetical protein GCM10027051_03370 [Niabella terrae]
MLSRKSFLEASGLASAFFVASELLGSGQPSITSLPAILSRREKQNSYWYIGHLMSVLIRKENTDNNYALLRCTERRGLEPPPHIHTKENETFLVLDGTVIYTVGNTEFKATAGEIMFLPKNIQHSFKIQTETLETLMLLTPGGFENYFIEMSEPAEALRLPPMPRGKPDIAKLIATASKYGIKFPKV